MALAGSRAGWALGLAAAVALATSVQAAVRAPAARPTIELVDSGGQLVVEIRGLDPRRLAELAGRARWTELFAVFTSAATERRGELPPLMGAYSVTGTTVRFTPRFALIAGETYVARWTDSQADSEGAISATLSVPGPSTELSTLVTGVFPSTDVVPENLLRLYVEFSAPMSRGAAQDHIHLLDQSGAEVDAPFVAPERELWSPDRTRLTLFFDPGRIKRGVGPNSEVGPPLVSGGVYRLLVDSAMRDSRGLPLARGHEKSYRVSEPDRDQPSTEGWLLEPPTGPREPVVLTFPEPLDRGLLGGLLEVLNEAGESLAGEVTVGSNETRWSFRPEQPWKAEVYRVRVATQLEDPAGNSLLRPFEIALVGGTVPSDRPRYVELPFSPR